MSTVKYRELLSSRDIASVLTVVNIGRLSSGVVPFGIVAYFTDKHAYAQAGIASSVFMVVTALTAPAKGRMISRLSPKVTLLPMSILYALACAAGILLADQLPFVVVLAFILTGGACAPPTGAVVRSLWTEIAGDNDAENRALHSLDSVSEEFTFAIAPVITAAIWAWAGAVWAVPIGGVLTIVGTALLLAVGLTGSAPTRHVLTQQLQPDAPTAKPTGFRGRCAHAVAAYRSRAAVGLLVPMLGLGAAMGALSIVLPAWASNHVGSPAFSGVLLGVVSLAGAIAGLVAPKLPTAHLSDVRQYQLAAGTVAISMVVFAVSGSVAVSLIAAVLLGVGMTPMFISAYVLVGKIARKQDHTEINAALGSGFNLGDGLTGLVIGVLITLTSGAVALGVFAAVVAVLASAAGLLPRHSPTDTAAAADRSLASQP